LQCQIICAGINPFGIINRHWRNLVTVLCEKFLESVLGLEGNAGVQERVAKIPDCLAACANQLADNRLTPNYIRLKIIKFCFVQIKMRIRVIAKLEPGRKSQPEQIDSALVNHAVDL
jgi:hypothetical protein